MTEKKFNKLLEKQLSRALKGKDREELSPEIWKLLHSVSNSYDHYERDRKLLERAMHLSSEEIRKSYEQKLIQTELERSNQYLQQFVSIASHDLKAPLRTINSFTQLLNRQLAGQLDKESQEYMNFILFGVKGMQNLLEDLTSFARIGLEREAPIMVNFNTILEGVERNLGYAIEESSAEIILKNPLPIQMAYPYQVIQLFQNIIGNAIKFRKENVTPKIVISCVQHEDQYQISIQDNGIGIDQEKHSKAFEAFSRLSFKTDIAGTGLGLSICKKIVEGWQGKIWFESAINKGTTFIFTIPIHQTNEASKEVSVAASSNP